MARTLEFANVTLTFGPKRVMADLLDEVVLPAFFDDTLRRHYGETTYFFHGVTRLNLGTRRKPEPAIAGTFVKDTILRREQFFNQTRGEIQKDLRKLPTSPSVTFVLLLATHKLLYLHETSQSPGLESFETTLKKFLMAKYMEFINQEYTKRRDLAEEGARSNITKKSLRKEYLPPELSVIHLSNEKLVADFLDRFKILRSAQVELVRLNAELPAAQFFVDMEREREAVGANKSTLIQTNPDGLNKQGVKDQLAIAASEGNSKLTLNGVTEHDEPLKVTNDDIRLRIPMKNLPDDLAGKAAHAFTAFSESLIRGDITVAKPDEEEADIIRGKFRFD